MQIQSYFSGKDNLQQTILDRLEQAEKSILVAVAWFTDQQLFQKLIEKQEQGVAVELIITRHEINDKSKNYYRLIEENGGVFIQIGDENGLMHNKFCVIDYQTVINGSFNWTIRANTGNNENITIVDWDARMTNDFVAEFERLKQIAGFFPHNSEEAEIGKAIKLFQLFKAFISIGDASKINPYLYELKDTPKVKPIVDLLFQGNYQRALLEIEAFIKANTQLVSVSAAEKAFLLSQIKLISYQIEHLVIEKAEIEGKIELFNHRYILELNPLISQILSLKKKIYEKLKKYGIEDDRYKIAFEEFKKVNEEYEAEVKIEIPALEPDEQKDIKKMYREAVSYCHPDSPNCIYEDKTEAARIFDELTKAYKTNNLEKVRYLLNELRLGNKVESNSFDELEHLRAKLATLKQKYAYLLQDLNDLKASEVYDTILKLNDWNAYFEQKKNLLQQELETLKESYIKNEQ